MPSWSYVVIQSRNHNAPQYFKAQIHWYLSQRKASFSIDVGSGFVGMSSSFEVDDPAENSHRLDIVIMKR